MEHLTGYHFKVLVFHFSHALLIFPGFILISAQVQCAMKDNSIEFTWYTDAELFCVFSHPLQANVYLAKEVSASFGKIEGNDVGKVVVT